jgi:predicted O-methyltransferase YrrM
MRSFRHWTPRYIFDRLALLAYERQYPHHPWLTRNMIEILETWLRPDDVGLEFGSGRSTVWFAQRVGYLTSVEHDSSWYKTVTNALRDLGGGVAEKVNYNLCEDGINESDSSSYVNIAKRVRPSSLDFCLVDGVARDYCALASLDKLKPGGILIIDNVNWYMPRQQPSIAPNSRRGDDYASATWRDVGREVAGWRCIWTTNGIWDSAFWVKPNQQSIT